MKNRVMLCLVVTAFLVTCGTGEAFSQTDFWQKVTGPNADTVNCISINASGTLFAGTPGRVARSTDNGGTWTLSNPGLDIDLYGFAISTDGTIVGSGLHGLYRSSDNGSNWTKLTDPGNGVKTLAINDSGHIFIGWGHELGGGVERSTDNGASWVNTSLGANSYALAINASGTIFSGGWKSDGACVYRSTDNGSTWANMHFMHFSYPVSSLGISPTGHIFVGTSTYGIFRSTDNGVSWRQINSGLTARRVTDFAFNAIGHIFAAGFDNDPYAGLGVFRSTDDGETWTAVNSGLTTLEVNSVAVSPGGTIFAATDSGLFRSVQSTTSVSELSADTPIAYSLDQNYPNPFNPSTTILYGLPNRSHVSLTVFNPLGQHVARLVNGDMEAGYHEVKFDASGLSSGVYLYRMQAGDFVQTRKLLLIR